MSPEFDNSYARLPERFFSRLSPVPVSQPGLVRINESLATLLGIDREWLSSADGLEVLAGNRVPAGADPIATVYAGHQFGHWNPQLGDGRAILLGELVGSDGNRYDIQLKGSGKTPYSRSGDGRAPLGPVLREYIVSEAMAALGIPTTRALAAVTTGDTVYREEPFPGGVLARVAKSHIRIGTLQYLVSVGDVDGLGQLVAHVIERHYSDLAGAENPPLALYEEVCRRQASLVARWLGIGFIHGVMNTDNMLLSGETIDYGPCAFMDAYDESAVYSYIDQGGRYAFGNQPGIAHWNLACLGQALLPVIGEDREQAVERVQGVLDKFPARFDAAYQEVFRAKLGLQTDEAKDGQLIRDFLATLQASGSDFTLAFRRLGELPVGDNGVQPLFEFSEAFEQWLTRWRSRCQREPVDDAERAAAMADVNPALIPRNHRVEQAIEAAYQGNFDLFHGLVDRLARPFEYEGEQDQVLATPPTREEIVANTFCGT